MSVQMKPVIGKSEAKTHFYEISDQVARTGQNVIVTDRGTPLVQIIPVKTGSIASLWGVYKGQVSAPEGWDEFTDEDYKAWYEGPVFPA